MYVVGYTQTEITYLDYKKNVNNVYLWLNTKEFNNRQIENRFLISQKRPFTGDIFSVNTYLVTIGIFDCKKDAEIFRNKLLNKTNKIYFIPLIWFYMIKFRLLK